MRDAVTLHKICTKCGTGYPATTEYFHRHKQKSCGLQPACKICRRKQNADYQQTEQGKAGHIKANLKYRQTEKGKTASRRATKKYWHNHSKKCHTRVKEYRRTIAGSLRNTFAHMNARCNNPEHIAYHHYGGRGIELNFSSDEFVNYVMDVLCVDPRGFEVDRIDNNGNYEPGNIRFVTHAENLKNRRPRVFAR